MVEYSDKEIIEGIKSNRRVDQYVLYLHRHNFRSIANFIRTNSGSQQDAEDIVQEALLIFINLVRTDRFRQEASIKTLLFSISRNLWFQQLKKAAKALKKDIPVKKAEPELKLQNIIIEKEFRAQILAIFEKLGGDCKKLLSLFYFDRLSYEAILEIRPFSGYKNEHVLRTKKYLCWKKFKILLNEEYKHINLHEGEDEREDSFFYN